MSLEAALAANTEAHLNLTASVQALIQILSQTPAGATPTPGTVAAAEAPAASKDKASSSVKSAEKNSSATTEAPETGNVEAGAGSSSGQATVNAGSSSTEAPAIAYEEVSAATVKLASAKGRDAALAVLGQFGVDHGSKLKPDQWGPYIEATTQALAA